jgi:large subunit ribosomal protein L3
MDQSPRFIREIRLDPADVAKFEVGKVLKAADVFKAGDVVDAVGVSKGMGHQGVIMRW